MQVAKAGPGTKMRLLSGTKSTLEQLNLKSIPDSQISQLLHGMEPTETEQLAKLRPSGANEKQMSGILNTSWGNPLLTSKQALILESIPVSTKNPPSILALIEPVAQNKSGGTKQRA